jgi:hypothetical protein
MGVGLVTRFIALFDTMHDYVLQFTITDTLVSTLTSSLLLLGSGFQQQMFPFLWVPKLSPALAINFSQQQLTTADQQQFSICSS